MKKWILGVIIFCMWITASARVFEETINAQALIERWFSDVKEENYARAGAFLAPQFLSLHTDGITRDRDQEITLIRSRHMQDYTLTDFQFSYSGNIIVVTFKVKGVSITGNRPYLARTSGRMAILQRQGGQARWLLVAYANLDTMT